MDSVKEFIERIISSLVQASGLTFTELAALAIMAAIVLFFFLRLVFAKSPAKPPEKKEPLQQLTTDRANLDPENPALVGYRQILESKGTAPAEQHTLIQEFASQLENLHGRLSQIATGQGEENPSLQKTLSDARMALASGAVDEAAEILGAIGQTETNSGRGLQKKAERHLMDAALSRLVAGDLEMVAQNTLEAAEHYRAAIESVPPGNEILLAECLNKHGTAMYRGRNPEAAAISFKRSIRLVERIKGPNDPDLATALNNLAMLYYIQGEYTAAEPLYKRAIEIDRFSLGPEAVAVGTDLNNLALLYKKQGRVNEAEPVMKQALEIKKKHFDPGHPSLVKGLRNYANLLRALGRDEEAETFEKQADVLPPKRRPEGADT